MTYLDHAATTPMRPGALAAWTSVAADAGNPASLHDAGRRARRVVEESRERIAALLGVPARSVLFTSGATESDNIAVTGGFRARSAADPDRRTLIAPRTEHKAVLEPMAAAADSGARIVWLDTDRDGRIDLQQLAERVRLPDVALVALMAVNNEVGTVHPIDEAAAICAAAGVPLHCDAVQAVGTVPVHLAAVATAAVSAHKFGGPMGAGVLVMAPDTPLEPLVRGGGHESGVRAGTLDVPGVAAMAAALAEAVAEREARVERLRSLRALLLDGLAGALGAAEYTVNSPDDGHPGIVNMGFPGCEGDALMMLMDSAGVCVSTGSACTVGIPRPSHVLQAMGRTDGQARSALRISLGWNSTPADVEAVLAALPGSVARARRAGLVGVGS